MVQSFRGESSASGNPQCPPEKWQSLEDANVWSGNATSTSGASLGCVGNPVSSQDRDCCSSPVKRCGVCGGRGVCMRRLSGRGLRCRSCFCEEFEEEVFCFIEANDLLPRGTSVCVGISGGKDSAALLHVLQVLNARHDRDWRLKLLAVDEGIQGYRDKALEAARDLADAHHLPLTVLTYEELFGGWSMDKIHELVRNEQEAPSSCSSKSGSFTSYCSYCGVFRRQALQRGAEILRVEVVATGHNLDDCAETTLLNLTRGDFSRLHCSADPGKTRKKHDGRKPDAAERGEASGVRRVKPLLRCFQKEIVLYVHFQKLTYFATECTYSWGASRGDVRNLLTKFQLLRQPHRIRDLVRAASMWHSLAREEEETNFPQTKHCSGEFQKEATFVACCRCGAPTSNSTCRACAFVGLLNQRAAMATTESSSGETAKVLQHHKIKAMPRLAGTDSF